MLIAYKHLPHAHTAAVLMLQGGRWNSPLHIFPVLHLNATYPAVIASESIALHVVAAGERVSCSLTVPRPISP